MVEFHFYYPRRADTLKGEDSPIVRKRYKVERVWIPKWDAERFFCRCWGIADKKAIFIFGKMSPTQLTRTIEHEVVHIVITRMIGDYVSTLLDNLDERYWL